LKVSNSISAYDFIEKGHTMTSFKNKGQEASKAPIAKQWLNPKEVFNEYGFSVSTLAKWRMSNLHLPYSKMGKYVKYKRCDIEAFLNENRIEARGA